ncbi:MAG: DinB family protein [Phycisphaerales bacterium]
MSATAVATSFASMIKPPAELGLAYAEALLKNIPDETFAHMPSRGPGKDVNSPAFNIGHLATYPDARIFGLLGRDDLVKPLPFSIDLFKAGAQCVDEPGKYPSKQVIVSTFFDRYRAAIDALASVPDERFAMQNPTEGRMRELFPTLGAAITFLLVGHPQSHLGQVSVWRRLMGLGSAF